MRLMLAFLSLLFAAPAVAQPPDSSGHKLYVVLYEVTVDQSGRLSALKVDKVLDPSLATSPDDAMNHPVDIALPETYLAAVRAFLGRRDHRGGPNPFFTYTFFDPSRPDRADLEPDAQHRAFPRRTKGMVSLTNRCNGPKRFLV
jgi:hypothetical protein